MKSRLIKNLFVLAAGLATAMSPVAHAQSLPYGDVTGADSDGGDDDGDAPVRHGRRIGVTPYIEAGQVALAELSPGSDVLTYSTVAVGVDMDINGRNNQGSLSVRYERRFGWGNNSLDSDTLSGVARFKGAIVPGALHFEAGGLAARTNVENNGAAVNGGVEFGDAVSQVYSVYAGPSVHTQMGAVAVDGHYRLGYTRVESPNSVVLAPGQVSLDVFDDSVNHSAALHAGTKAGDGLPIGIGVGAGYNREDISNLDQRAEDLHVRGDVSIPLGSDLAVVGGVGWERVEISSRDAVRDTITGLPVISADGRFVTDKSQPRALAFNAEGLIWDAGVMWRPSRRTALEAHVGRRYGSTSYYGSFAYAPNSRTSMNISVYDTITGFGGMLNNALANLPTQFQTIRNPLNGDLGGCVSSTGSVGAGQGVCLNGALASVRSSVFRARGGMATFGVNNGNTQYGIGGGYDRRKFIAAPGTVLAVANGVIDENYWLAAYLNGRIDRNSSFSTNVYANWYQSGDALSGDVSALGATAAYYRSITSRLSATAAVGIDGVDREVLPDVWSAQALVGLRYEF